MVNWPAVNANYQARAQLHPSRKPVYELLLLPGTLAHGCLFCSDKLLLLVWQAALQGNMASLTSYA